MFAPPVICPPGRPSTPQKRRSLGYGRRSWDRVLDVGVGPPPLRVPGSISGPDVPRTAIAVVSPLPPVLWGDAKRSEHEVRQQDLWREWHARRPNAQLGQMASWGLSEVFLLRNPIPFTAGDISGSESGNLLGVRSISGAMWARLAEAVGVPPLDHSLPGEGIQSLLAPPPDARPPARRKGLGRAWFLPAAVAGYLSQRLVPLATPASHTRKLVVQAAADSTQQG